MKRKPISVAPVLLLALALGIVALGAGTLGIGAGRAIAAPPSGPLKEWPCPAPQLESLSAQTLYGKPLPAPLPPKGAWEADTDVKRVVRAASAPENMAQVGADMLVTLARSSGPRKQEMLLLAYSGILERLDALREILVEGIGHQVVNSRLVADELAANERALAALSDDKSDAAAKRRKDLETARMWNRRSLGDLDDKAGLACHQLEHAEKKAEILAAAIRQQIEGP